LGGYEKVQQVFGSAERRTNVEIMQQNRR
jgi:hypothetical protein